jgi:hypothetical protein
MAWFISMTQTGSDELRLIKGITNIRHYYPALTTGWNKGFADVSGTAKTIVFVKNIVME